MLKRTSKRGYTKKMQRDDAEEAIMFRLMKLNIGADERARQAARAVRLIKADRTSRNHAKLSGAGVRERSRRTGGAFWEHHKSMDRHRRGLTAAIGDDR